MRNQYFATGNIKHNGVVYARGDEVVDLTDEQAEAHLSNGVISTDEVVDETPEDESRIQSPEEKAKARSGKNQRSQINKDGDKTPEVGGESADSGEPSVDEDAEEKNENGSSNGEPKNEGGDDESDDDSEGAGDSDQSDEDDEPKTDDAGPGQDL